MTGRAADLKPVTVVTGGSTGIGLEIARVLAQKGRTLALVARSPEQLSAALRTLQMDHSQAWPNAIITIADDIALPDAAKRISRRLEANGYYLDELVNCAGSGLSGQFIDYDPADVDALLNLNVTALSRLIREALPGMCERGRGGIINLASLGGFVPGPYQSAYYASKAYVISLTRALAHENRGKGVRFCVVAPGPVETSFHAKMNAESAFYRRFLPALSPSSVAKATIFWYQLRAGVVVPGVLYKLTALALWVLPGAVTIPIVAFLLNPRDDHRDA
ncbi:MAG: SDR family NAD(P)-dependent oxidoreductase [Hyphomicrobiaceae bacterium]